MKKKTIKRNFELVAAYMDASVKAVHEKVRQGVKLTESERSLYTKTKYFPWRSNAELVKRVRKMAKKAPKNIFK